MICLGGEAHGGTVRSSGTADLVVGAAAKGKRAVRSERSWVQHVKLLTTRAKPIGRGRDRKIHLCGTRSQLQFARAHGPTIAHRPPTTGTTLWDHGQLTVVVVGLEQLSDGVVDLQRLSESQRPLIPPHFCCHPASASSFRLTFW